MRTYSGFGSAQLALIPGSTDDGLGRRW